MFASPAGYDTSNEFAANQANASNPARLKEGWLPWSERKVDLEDDQYNSFRDGILVLVPVSIAFCIGGRLADWWSGLGAPRKGTISATTSISKATRAGRKLWYFSFSVVFIYIFHGSGILQLFWILPINYGLSRVCTWQDGAYAKVGVVGTWLFACTMVLLCEHYDGFRFMFSSPYMFFLNRTAPKVAAAYLHPDPMDVNRALASLTRADKHGHAASLVDKACFKFFMWCMNNNGMSKWKIQFPLVMLKMISFNMDRYWAAATAAHGHRATMTHAERDAAKDERRNAAGPTERGMASTSHGEEWYTPMWYVSYIMYPPLYIAGPTITFNSFIASVRGHGIALTAFEKLVVVLRAFFCFLVFELHIHYLYIGSIASTGFYTTFLDDPLKCIQFSVMAVIYLYLKFLVIWRFFRAWAIVDGVYVKSCACL